jgi:membrane fusion protein, copper/silver efflux system
MISAGFLEAGSQSVVDRLLGQYFIIHRSLASDSISGVSTAIAEIARISRQASSTELETRAQMKAISEAAGRFSPADLKSARNGLGQLSDSLIAYLKVSGAKTNPPYQFFCSMVKKNWLQPDKLTRNPYYGPSMLKCGELVQSDNSAEQREPMEHHH